MVYLAKNCKAGGWLLKCWNKISWIVSWCNWVGFGTIDFRKACPRWNWSCRWSMFCICRCWRRAICSIVNCLPCLKYVCQAFVYSLELPSEVYSPRDKRKYTLPTLFYIIQPNRMYTNQEIGRFINFSVIPWKIFPGISIFVESIIMMAKAIFPLMSWQFCKSIRLVSFRKISRN